MFVACRGWLWFLQRNSLSLRRCTTMAQKNQKLLTEKLVSFVDYIGKAVISKRILKKDIIAIDETAVWSDIMSPTTVVTWGVKSVALKTMGHEKNQLLPLMPRLMSKIQALYCLQRGCSWSEGNAAADLQCNDHHFCEWLDEWYSHCRFVIVRGRKIQLHQVAPHVGLVPLPHQCCHQSWNLATISTMMIPGGYTKYIQAPSVMWNRPFKQSLHDAYDQWKAWYADKE